MPPSLNFTGYIPDPAAGPNQPYPLFEAFKAALINNIPAEVVDEYHVPEKVDVFDQQQEGSCVANGWLGLLEILLGLENETIVPLSRNFLYWHCRLQMKTTGYDSGTFPFLAGERLRTIGVIPEAMWPYGMETMLKPPPGQIEDLEVAYANRVTSIGRISSIGDERLDDFQALLLRNHPAVFCTRVGLELSAATATTVLQPPSKEEGGHCMLLTGFRKYRDGRREWRVRNSYGPYYADQGHVWFSDMYMKWTKTIDCWTGTRMNPVLF